MKKLIIGGLLLFFASAAFSSPNLSLVTLAEWQSAYSNGKAVAGTGWNSLLEAHYPGQSARLRVPDLHVLAEIPEAPGEPGLLMRWGSVGDSTEPVIAYWQYLYDLDPDLTGTTVCLCIFPPCHIRSVSFGLVDVNGKTKGWDWNIPADLACGFQHCFCIDPTGGAGQAGSTSFWQDVGFDITKVVGLIFDENGVVVAQTPVGVPGAWNYWKQITVQPKPTDAEKGTWGMMKALYKQD